MKFYRSVLTYSRIATLSYLWVLSGCAAYLHQPTGLQRARLGEETTTTAALRNLPKAKEKVVVAVYKFRDQTGQYKLSETGSTFSTVVSQGTTNILLKALEESGWFTTIERENVSNLLNERKIIRSSVAQYKEGENLPPLLFAGVILEGGIVSYDANIITGGAGLRYFATGGSTQYRQDRVTVYLRAVATRSGKILKTVYTSKTILSQSVDAGIFRYVTFKKLLEAETGFSTNEPSQMAVTEAIEKAVQALVLEGIHDGLWAVSDQDVIQAKSELERYDAEKVTMSQTDVYGMQLPQIKTPRFTIQPYASLWRFSGDYAGSMIRPAYGVTADLYLKPAWGLQVNAGNGTLACGQRFSGNFTMLNGSLVWRSLPTQRLSPIFTLGGGILSNRSANEVFRVSGLLHATINAGIGCQYSPNGIWGFRSMLNYQQSLNDQVDGLRAGQFNDFVLQASFGVTLSFGRLRQGQPTALTKRVKSK
ncbi:CsgG/HfaB family protein [Spirosoma fluviale]|uniref:Curli production assembly/transport component CsgG n=1 Tax=Spirosoma fluviale TaxID=1597977 RepID=A0A286G033_9BACT|nr:CsgG/HfaB family protein [Spirosoma fluviale]SOD88863.1 curli production assembly/transport component CsgG [Spirosoma fluviale]